MSLLKRMNGESRAGPPTAWPEKREVAVGPGPATPVARRAQGQRHLARHGPRRGERRSDCRRSHGATLPPPVAVRSPAAATGSSQQCQGTPAGAHHRRPRPEPGPQRPGRGAARGRGGIHPGARDRRAGDHAHGAQAHARRDLRRHRGPRAARAAARRRHHHRGDGQRAATRSTSSATASWRRRTSASTTMST